MPKIKTCLLYTSILDYKSGQKNFRLDEVYYGLNLQMLVYLFTLCRNGRGKLANLLPAGALYLPALGGYTAASREAGEPELARARLEQYRMNGLLLDDPQVLRAMEADLGGLYIPYADGRKTDALYSLAAVSYTHLDVYKRQGAVLAPRRSGDDRSIGWLAAEAVFRFGRFRPARPAGPKTGRLYRPGMPVLPAGRLLPPGDHP